MPLHRSVSVFGIILFNEHYDFPNIKVNNGLFHSRWVYAAGLRTQINEPGGFLKLVRRPEVEQTLDIFCC